MNNADDTEQQDSLQVAIIGMACRFPGATTLEEFWANLRAGVESITQLEYQDLLAAGVDPAEFRDPRYVRRAPILANVENFDAAFFGYTALEAEIMDPQQRIFLECAWEALELAGYNPDTFAERIGVYAGSRTNSYLFNLVSNPELFKSLGVFQISVGNDLANLATRISYKLNLKGPSYGVHTACSTSLVAIHLACQSLLLDECQIALAGGVAINIPHQVGYLHQEGGILSPDGHLRAFDAQAGGTIFGSGAGVVVLKRLEDAVRDGDTIHAVIRGSATNNDGSVKASFTAPSVEGQMEVILDALAEADVRPESISYVEAHGTGTALGDPIEIRALTRAFRADTQKKGFCAIGSVKTNVGHLDAAAGMSSLLKTVLALKHGELPPTLHYTAPNPKIDFANSPFYVNTALTPWPQSAEPRRAGVSSFGFGGTNAHIILEEAPSVEPSAPALPWQLLLLSAKTSTALEMQTERLQAHLASTPDLNLADVAFTLQVGRKALAHRRLVVVQDQADAVATLANRDPQRLIDAVQETRNRPVAWMFSGQGAQYVNMGRELYRTEPVFRKQIDQCAKLLQPHLGLDLRTVLFPPPEREAAATEQLQQTALAQPALFVIEYSLAQLWRSWSIAPQALIGHSIGEYVAACLAGVFSLEDALSLVATRGKLMQSLPAGSMLAVSLPEAEVLSLLTPELSLAAVNGPQQCVVAGPTEAVDALAATLAERAINHRRLHTSHAFHSAMMESILNDFQAAVARVKLGAPQQKLISNLSGQWLTAAEATDPAYWARHLRQAVRFADGLQTLLAEGNPVLLEVGPGTTLATFARQQGAQAVFASLRHPNDQRADRAFVLASLGQLWLQGVTIDWDAIYANSDRRRLPLPTYPFERQRFWIEAAGRFPATRAAQTTLTKQADVADWLYRPQWDVAALGEASLPAQARWLIFSDEAGLGAELTAHLRTTGQQVISVKAGAQFAQQDEQNYILPPADRAAYATLIEQTGQPTHIVHGWNVRSSAEQWDTAATIERSYYSLLHLTHALTRQSLAHPIQLTIVSNEVQALTGDEALDPLRALLLGPALVIPQELPQISCRTVDLVLPASGLAALSKQLLADCLAQGDDQTVAYRGAERLVQRFVPQPSVPASATPARLRQGGVYVITGGLGSIGLLLAEHLARTVQAKLVLLGRTTLPKRSAWPAWLEAHSEDDALSRKLRAVESLEQAGAEVLVLAADVADSTSMQAAINTATAHFGALHGVIHAAGMLAEDSFKPAQELDRATSEAHFQPKVYGLQVLAEAIKDHELDFCFLFSSLSAVLGGLGYAAYAAANIFLDAFAAHQNRAGRTAWLSVDWDSWHYDWEAEHATSFGTTLAQLAITPAEGIEVFERILALPTSQQVIVSTGDLYARLDQWVKLRALRTSTPSSGSTPQPLVGSRDEIEQRIARVWERVLGIPTVGLHDNFFDLGGNSLSGMQLLNELNRELQVQLAPVALFEAPTVSALARQLAPTPAPATTSAAPMAQATATTEIAIIGLAGRFPGAESVDAFWANLTAGVESITFFANDELAPNVPAHVLEQPSYVKARPVLRDVEGFDAGLFGYTPREAELMDPQHRVLMECAWAALEDAGYAPDTFTGPIGMFAGSSLSTYLLNLFSNPEIVQSVDPLQTIVGNAQDSLTTSISYKLNLKGPSLAVQTFCSTSLVAVHLACQSLRHGECQIALAGGVSITVPQDSGYHYQEDGILSPDGHCRAFDAQAAGTLFGNGVGLVVLKPLADAQRDGDTIHAVIRGTAINNDGALKVGYTAPSVEGQSEVIAQALAAAGVPANSIGYVEAHGTGTALGDPIEVAALTKAFRATTDARQFCALGSVKTNIGHLDRAAGVAALIKAVMALKHGVIPPTLHYTAPNPKIDFPNSPFYVNAELIPWPATEGPRRAGVSSLGFGGTNAHVIVEQAPAAIVESAPAAPGQLLVLSAKTASALERQTEALHAHLASTPQLNLADVAFTLQVGRKALPYRRAVVVQDYADAVATLATRPVQRLLDGVSETRSRPVVWLFSGQGAQYVGMAHELYQSEPVFRNSVDRCAALLEPHLGLDLRTVVYAPGDQAQAAAQLQQTSLTQPALFMIEYSLAQLWQSWGITASVLMGHSIGEYVAACLAGVFSLEDALSLVATRGKLMQNLPAGSMLAVSLPEAEVLGLLTPELSLAAVNGPQQCVVAGPSSAIDALAATLEARAINHRRLHTSHAFHSTMMDPILSEFQAAVARVKPQAPQHRMISNVSGTWLSAAEATDPAYWARHLRQTVRFADGVATAVRQPGTLLLEVGPGRSLITLARQSLGEGADHQLFGSLPAPQEATSDRQTWLRTLGQLWLAGLPVAWAAGQAAPRRRIALPTYPFEHQRYWISAGSVIDQAPTTRTAATLDDWFYLPSWKRTRHSTKTAAQPAQRWLILGQDEATHQLAAQLSQAGHAVAQASAGQQYAALAAGHWTINPAQPADFHALLRELHTTGELPTHVLFGWSLEPAPFDPAMPAAMPVAFERLVWLLQALEPHLRQQPIQLNVLTDQLFDVNGTEQIAPLQALVVGVCRTASHEQPNLVCRVLDVSASALPVAQVAEELLSAPGETLVAYRGAHRWVPILAAEPISAPAVPAVRQGGVYALVQGLNADSFALAQSLASATPHLALIEPSALPDRTTWPAWLGNPSDPAITAALAAEIQAAQRLPLTPEQIAAHLAETVPALEARLPLHAAPASLEADFDRLCTSYVYEYVARHLTPTPGQTLSVAEITARLGVVPKYVPLLRCLLGILAQAQIVTLRDDQVAFGAAAANVPAASSLRQELDQRYPSSRPGFDLLTHCVEHYDVVLSGAQDAISVLYPGGQGTLVRSVEESQLRFSNIERCRAVIAAVLAQTAAAPLDRPLRILEVGGGDGNVTWPLLAQLQNANIEYVFTDLGKSFVTAAEQYAQQQGWSFVAARQLDISADPLAQGLAPHSFDLILGAEVLHATPHLATSLTHLRRLLVPQGVLLLLEATKTRNWANLVWGLLDGWWNFAPEGVRDHSPLLTSAAWQSVFAQQALTLTSTYPAVAADNDYTTFVLQQPALPTIDSYPLWLDGAIASVRQATTTRIAQVQSLETLGAQVTLIAADAADHNALARAFATVERTAGLINGLIYTPSTLPHQPLSTLRRHGWNAALGTSIAQLAALDRSVPLAALDWAVILTDGSWFVAGSGQTLTAASHGLAAAWASQNPRTPWLVLGWDVANTPAKQRAALLERSLGASGTAQLLVTPTALGADWAQASAPRVGSSTAHAISLHPRPSLPTPYVAPSTETEHTIVAVWQEILGIAEIGVHDSFIDFGGDSLQATQLVARLRDRFQVELPVRTFFEQPTVAGLAQVIAQLQADRASAEASDMQDLLALLADLSDDDVAAELHKRSLVAE